MNKLIFFELNEVPLKILDYFISVRPHSWLAREQKKIIRYESYSENQGHLSPWNTWPTVHRGVSNDIHFLSDINQDTKKLDKEFPPIWKILSQNGIDTAVFGSLHSYPVDRSKEYSFYVPDVFSPTPETHPELLEKFQEVNLKMSRASARNVSNKLEFENILALSRNAAKLGFTGNTMASVMSQLIKEKIKPWSVVRRRGFQAILSFDVYYRQLSKKKPAFSTFFTNHVASSLHRYWAALFPKEYENMPFEADWRERYDNEIIWSMERTDDMLKRLASFVKRHPEYKLVICSSMGQEAVECEPTETLLMVEDHEKFMKLFGLTPPDYTTLPAMIPQFNYQIESRRMTRFLDSLATLKINNQPVSFRHLDGNRVAIDLSFSNLKDVQIYIESQSVNISDSGLKNTVIDDKSSATAYHIPEGSVYIYHPSYTAKNLTQTQLPTKEIFSGILKNFGITIPDYAHKSALWLN